MIRDFKYEDAHQFIQIINNGYIIDETEITNFIQDNDKKLFVYDKAGIKGFGHIKITNQETKRCDVQLYVDPKERRKGIGSTLYKEVVKYLGEVTPNLLITEFKIDSDDPTSFYRKLGYKKWYGCHELHYKGTFQPDTDMEFVPYIDKYYEQYAKCRQDCFYELRKENDIQPYVPFQLSEEDREKTLKRKEYKYIALMNEQLIASFDLEEGYLDTIIVSPNYQGKGYGKKATQFAINKALSQDAQLIHLSVIESNTKAMSLYKSLSFEIVQTTHVYRQFVGR
jgi:ribosomal protein S18 acetylase RimI-like enzyme